MADTPPPPARPFLAHTIATCVASCWQARIVCMSCGHETTWRATDLARLPHALTLAALGRNAACSRCDHVGADITLSQDHGATRVADAARAAAKEAARAAWTPARRGG